MKNWITGIIIVAILIGVGYGIRYCQESSNLPTEVPPNDSTYTLGDTVFIPQDTVYIVKWEKIPARTDIDSTGIITKTVTKDTLLVMDKDSINIKATANYYPQEDLFDLGLNVDFRGYDQFRVDTLKVTEYYPIKVPVDEPFYDEFVWGAGVMTVIFTALILLLGN